MSAEQQSLLDTATIVDNCVLSMRDELLTLCMAALSCSQCYALVSSLSADTVLYVTGSLSASLQEQ